MAGRKANLRVVGAPQPGLPPPPKWLPQAGQQEWWRAAADLNRRGLLFDGALPSLAAYCALTAQVEAFQRMLNDRGLIDPETGAPNPIQGAMLKACMQMRLLSVELGLSVVSRSRAFTGKGSEEQDWEQLGVG